MAEAIADTGPFLHLTEIGQLDILNIFDRLKVPNLVAVELDAYGVDLSTRKFPHIEFVNVEESQWQQVISSSKHLAIHPADAQVFVLAQSNNFLKLVLSDDLDLRRLLESHNATVVGSVGLLVRAYKLGRLEYDALAESINALFTNSTLYISRAFKVYVEKLIEDLK